MALSCVVGTTKPIKKEPRTETPAMHQDIKPHVIEPQIQGLEITYEGFDSSGSQVLTSNLAYANMREDPAQGDSLNVETFNLHLNMATGDFKPKMESVISVANIKQETQTDITPPTALSESSNSPPKNVRVLTEDRYSLLLARMHQLKELFVNRCNWSQSYDQQRDLFNYIMAGFSDIQPMPSSNLVQTLGTTGYDVNKNLGTNSGNILDATSIQNRNTAAKDIKQDVTLSIDRGDRKRKGNEMLELPQKRRKDSAIDEQVKITNRERNLGYDEKLAPPNTKSKSTGSILLNQQNGSGFKGSAEWVYKTPDEILKMSNQDLVFYALLTVEQVLPVIKERPIREIKQNYPIYHIITTMRKRKAAKNLTAKQRTEVEDQMAIYDIEVLICIYNALQNILGTALHEYDKALSQPPDYVSGNVRRSIRQKVHKMQRCDPEKRHGALIKRVVQKYVGYESFFENG